MAHLHKKFTDSQVKEMLQRYLNNRLLPVNHANVFEAKGYRSTV